MPIAGVGRLRAARNRGKTRTAGRTIELDPTTVDVLRGWRDRRAREDAEFDADGLAAHVFCRTDGGPTHPQLLSDAFKRLVRQSGLPPIRLHDLRHTHATLLLRAGVPAKVVSERLGHSTPGFTIATYQHVMPAMQADAANTFANLIASDQREHGSRAVASDNASVSVDTMVTDLPDSTR